MSADAFAMRSEVTLDHLKYSVAKALRRSQTKSEG